MGLGGGFAWSECAVHRACTGRRGRRERLAAGLSSRALPPRRAIRASRSRLYYTRSASASANRTFPIGASLAAGYTLNETYVFVTPSYTFRALPF